MNRALHKMTDDERETIVEHDKVLLASVLAEIKTRPDMAQMDEPEPTGAAAAYVILGACATVSFGLGALIVWWL
jgi:hypothetical protein